MVQHKFGLKIKSAQFLMKFDTLIKEIMLNFMVIIFFRDTFCTSLFLANLVPKDKNCSMFDEIWQTYETNNAQFQCDVIFFEIHWHLSILGKFSPKTKSAQYLMTVGTFIKQIMLNYIVMLFFRDTFAPVNFWQI